MALDFDQISAITSKYYVPKLEDNIFDSNPYLKRIKSRSMPKIDGGTSIMVPLEYAVNGAGGWYTGADTLDTSDTEVITAANYQWKQIYENISIKRSDELQNSGDSAKLNFVKSKMKNAEKSMLDKIGTGVYSAGTDSKSIVGLRVFCGTTNTVGGISQSSFSWWASNVDSTTTVMSMSALQTQYNAAVVDNMAPTAGLTNRTIFNLYYSLLQPQQRFTDSETAKGGFSSLMFNGIPVLADSHCPANHFFFINEDVVKLYVHRDEDMRFEPFQKPLDQNVRVAKIYGMMGFTSGNNRLLSCLSGITS
tara:strand:- start:3169 stop:4089 length:921 start_codon:yes stop_codon:yes gene_type:complete